MNRDVAGTRMPQGPACRAGPCRRTIQTSQAAWADALGATIGEEDLHQASILLERIRQAVTATPPE